MSANTGNQNKINRRTALRIYESVNLFYRKIPGDRPQNPPDFDDLLDTDPNPTYGLASLPVSESVENDTLQANLSTGGIAFTADEALLAGDRLMLRILLLSSLTTINVCGEVAYCKPSNPYEDDRYPFTVGARFVNLSDADSDLLRQHIERGNRRRIAVNLIGAAGLLTALTAPDLVWGLLVGLFHHLLEVVLHVAHLLFEYLEMGLDHVIEHAFHTDTHETQVIVFYILVSFALMALYLLGRKIPAWYRSASKAMLLYVSRKKSSLLYFWGQQSPVDKCKIVGVGGAALIAYWYLAI